MSKGVGHVNKARPTQVRERSDVVGVKVGNEDMRDIPGPKSKGQKLIDDQILLAQCDGSHPAVKAPGEFLGLIKETIRIARIKQHRAKTRMPHQRKHGGEVNTPPAAPLNGNVFGRCAVPGMKNVNFHFSHHNKSQEDLHSHHI